MEILVQLEKLFTFHLWYFTIILGTCVYVYKKTVSSLFAIFVFIDLSISPFQVRKSWWLNWLVERFSLLSLICWLTEVKDFFRGKEAIVKLLNELNTTLNSASLLLNDAEEDRVYDADDLVYKIDTEALRNELEGESHVRFYYFLIWVHILIIIIYYGLF